jgi:hypothetical protein
MWTIKADFVTDKVLDGGYWTSISYDTEEEAMQWWNAPIGKSIVHRKFTMTDPSGNVVATKEVDVMGREIY